MATKVLEAERAFEQVANEAEAIRNDAPHTIATMSPGDFWCQGDIKIRCLDKMPSDTVPVDQPLAQLVPGDTQGSRHCLSVDCFRKVKQYRFKNANSLDGPLLLAPEGMEIVHPEHGNASFPPGTYSVSYQRQFAEDLRRIAD